MLPFPKPLILCKLQCQILSCAAFNYQLQQRHSSNSHNHCHTRCAKKDHVEKFLTVCMTNLWKESLLVIQNASRAPDRNLNNLRYGMPFAQKVKLSPDQSHWRWIDQLQKVNNNTPPADLRRNATRRHGHYGVTLWHWPTLGWCDDECISMTSYTWVTHLKKWFISGPPCSRNITYPWAPVAYIDVLQWHVSNDKWHKMIVNSAQ